MRYMHIYLILLVALLCGGCSTTYVPISWDYGDKVKALSNTDTTLKIFYSKYDPQRQTLRVRGTSFAEVMMPYEVKYHLGAYRPDTKILYRNLYRKYTDKELRDVMVHEFAHHIWFIHMSHDQREKWRQYLATHPSPAQTMVRNGYDEKDFDKEDFAFVLQFPRRIDIEELATLKIITEEERDTILKELFPPPKPVITAKAPAKGSATAPATGAKADLPKPAPGAEGTAKVPAVADAAKGEVAVNPAADGPPVAKAPAAVGDAAAKVDPAAKATPAAEGASGTVAAGAAPPPSADTIAKTDPAAKPAAAAGSASPEKATPAAATADAAAATAKTAPATEGVPAAKVAPAAGAAPAATAEAANADQKPKAPAIMEEAPVVKIPPAADAPPAAIAESTENLPPAVKASAADGVPAANAAASAEALPTPATVLFISDDPAKTAAPQPGTAHH